MAPTPPSGKKIHLVLKDCYNDLKHDLSHEVIQELWIQKCISFEEWSSIKPLVQLERNEKFIDTLMTK